MKTFIAFFCLILFPVASYAFDLDTILGTTPAAEANNLETDGAAGIAVDEVPVGTAAGICTYTSIQDCDNAGNALNYDTTTHAFSCKTLADADIPNDITINTATSAGTITGDLDPDQLSGDTVDDNLVDTAILDGDGTGDCASGKVCLGDHTHSAYAPSASPTFTGSVNAGGADDLEIPNGTGPTVDTTGQIAIDTTSDQLIYYGASSASVIAPKDCKSATIENLAAADDNLEIGMFAYGVTITDVGVYCNGTCSTPAQISLEDRSGNAMTHTTPTAATGTGNATFQSVTAANSLVAGEGLRFDVDNTPSPETDTYIITYCFTVTAD